MKDNMLFVGDPESQSILDKFQKQNTNFCIKRIIGSVIQPFGVGL